MRSLEWHLVRRQYSLKQRQRWYEERTEVMLSTTLSNSFSLLSGNLLGVHLETVSMAILAERLWIIPALYQQSRPCCAKDVVSTVWCYKETDYFSWSHTECKPELPFISGWSRSVHSLDKSVLFKAQHENKAFIQEPCCIIYAHVYIFGDRTT